MCSVGLSPVVNGDPSDEVSEAHNGNGFCVKLSLGDEDADGSVL